MHQKFISKTSITIHAPASKIWETLIEPEFIKIYFYGANVFTTWQTGSPITFIGEYKGNQYEEKGVILAVKPNSRLQYSHWSNFDGLPDIPENYRTWTFDLMEKGEITHLAISEDNIPTVKQQKRSDEFWHDVLLSIKRITEK